MLAKEDWGDCKIEQNLRSHWYMKPLISSFVYILIETLNMKLKYTTGTFTLSLLNFLTVLSPHETSAFGMSWLQS